MEVDDWIGREVTDVTGGPYGRLDELFVGRSSGRPEFGIVSIGCPDGTGGKRVAVPLHSARLEGDALLLDLDREQVLSAPAVKGSVEEIPTEAGERVLEYFGVRPATTAAVPPVREGAEEDPEAMVVSEEQLVVDTRPRATERVRVRKAVVTEEVTVTVTLRREELVIEREPVRGDAVESAAGEARLTEGGDIEFLLHAEEPVVSKRVVPVERVSLRRDTVVEEQRITDEVRKERVEVDETPIQEEQPLHG